MRTEEHKYIQLLSRSLRAQKNQKPVLVKADSTF